MLRSIRALLGAAIVAQDGAIGFIPDVDFDDEHWTVRYLVVDTGHPMPQREVLIRPTLIAPEQPAHEVIRVQLTRAQVEKCPDADTDRPVYRRYDMAASVAHYGDAHLRSGEVVMGYDVVTLDGDAGQVEDFVIEGQSWAIANVVVGTRNWLPGKSVLVAPGAVERIDRPERKMFLRLTRAALRTLPDAAEIAQ